MGKIDTNPPKPAADRRSRRHSHAQDDRRGRAAACRKDDTPECDHRDLSRARSGPRGVECGPAQSVPHPLPVPPRRTRAQAGVGLQDQRKWIEDRVRDQVQHRRDAVLDVGGGVTALNALIEEVKLVRSLERRGVRPVLLYVLGSDRADLDYLERFTEDQSFLPPATVIVLNSGLVTERPFGAAGVRAAARAPRRREGPHRGAKIAPDAGPRVPLGGDRPWSQLPRLRRRQAGGRAPGNLLLRPGAGLALVERGHAEVPARHPAEWMPRTKQPLAVTD